MVNLVAAEDEYNLVVVSTRLCCGAPSVCTCHGNFCVGAGILERPKGEGKEALCWRQGADDLVSF